MGCSRLILAALLAAAAGAPTRAAEPDAAELAQALQRKYDTVRDFSADFVHTYEGGVLRKRLTERGRLIVKKPGKMRWVYTQPEPKEFVSDGVKLYSYIPQDRQVFVTDVPAGDRASTPALFLAGKGELLRDFAVSTVDVPPGMPDGTRALKLVPRTPQQEYDWLILVVDPETLQLRGLVTADAQGGRSSFAFANLKENVGIADRDFAFRMPRGVDVVTGR
ncbi:MAG: outer membrane lipoprotein carrier protein LolA [Acidobacteria bacterium]|nr:outer membrane lipoprotein carrier protein LolA [Acidobacteriota bacterium]